MRTKTSFLRKILPVVVLAAAGSVGCMKLDTTLPPAGPATQLSFFVHPGNAAVNEPLQPAVQVAVLDAAGIVVNNNGEFDITIELGANPGGGALTGDLTVRTVRGKAFFDNIVVSQPGVGYTLVATAVGFDPKTSTGFNVFGP